MIRRLINWSTKGLSTITMKLNPFLHCRPKWLVIVQLTEHDETNNRPNCRQLKRIFIFDFENYLITWFSSCSSVWNRNENEETNFHIDNNHIYQKRPTSNGPVANLSCHYEPIVCVRQHQLFSLSFFLCEYACGHFHSNRIQIDIQLMIVFPVAIEIT